MCNALQMPVLPDRIETERLVIRAWKPEDAPLLHAAVTASTEHLRPWMEWIAFEPTTVEDRRKLIEQWVVDAAEGRDVVYGVFLAGADGEGPAIGGCGFHDRVGPGGIEIGYWIHVDHCGQGYATELSRGLTDAAFAIDGIERVEIHTDKANAISARVPERLGYALTAEKPDAIVAPGEVGIDQTWTLLRADWR